MGLPNQQKAAVLTGANKIQLKTLALPKIKDDELLVQVAYAGMCGTDKELYQGLPGSAQAKTPIVLGHEDAGIVAAVGKAVHNFKPGDRVVIDPNIYCDHCYYCHTDRYELCENLQAVGVTRDGGMEEFFTAPEKVVYNIPNELPLKIAFATEPVSCGVHGIDLLNILPYQDALVIGDGFMGEIFCQLLKVYGAKSVSLTGRHDDKLAQEKKELGLDQVFNTAKTTKIGKYDVVIECVGKPDTQQLALDATKRGAQVLLFGVGKPDQTFPANGYEIYQKELTIKGAFINPHTSLSAIGLLASGRVKVTPFITNLVKLDQVDDILSGKIKNKGKAVIEVNSNLY